MISAVAIILSMATGWSAPAGQLTTLRAIHAVSNEEAHLAAPVDFEATVSFSRGYENLLFVQDGGAAIFVRPPSGMQLTPGDRVEIRGRRLRTQSNGGEQGR